jgi:hypothetical protein
VLAVPALSPRSIEAKLLRDVRSLPRRGVRLTVAHSTPRDVALPGFVRSLFERDGPKRYARVSRSARVRSVSDGTLALRTLYPLLADRGPRRPFRHERGWLRTDPPAVAALVEESPRTWAATSSFGRTVARHPPRTAPAVRCSTVRRLPPFAARLARDLP